VGVEVEVEVDVDVEMKVKMKVDSVEGDLEVVRGTSM
jgi:hypothetical protein